MKLVIVLAACLSVLSAAGQDTITGFSGPFTGDSKLPQVLVISPNGGETFNCSNPVPVSWDATDDSFGTFPISIGISAHPDSACMIIASGLPNTGTTSLSGTIGYYPLAWIWVIATDSFGSGQFDRSNGFFTVEDEFTMYSAPFTCDSKIPEVAVNMPNGGEILGFADPLKVEWNANDDSFGPYPISIGLSTERGGAFTLLAAGLPNSGSTVITPPGTITPYAKIRVFASDSFGAENFDTSDDYFTFHKHFTGFSNAFTGDTKPPAIVVIVPNGGETHYFSEPLLVKWDAIDDSFGATPVTISISTNGGTSYSTSASPLPDNDSAFITPPPVITGLAKIKITVIDDFGLISFDESDGVFSLQGIFVELKAYLEGPFTGSGMLPYLNSFSYLPLTQPYNQAPWYYMGNEAVVNIPANNVVDWVLVELRDAQDVYAANGSTVSGRQAVFINTDGSITSLDGNSPLLFGIGVNQNLFAVVRHRNHLDILSALPLNVNGNTYSYDFTDGANKVFGSTLGHKEVAPGIWGMAGGDGNADGQVNNSDKNDVWVAQSGLSGYRSGDFNMNGDVNNQDKLDMWAPNGGRSSQVVQ